MQDSQTLCQKSIRIFLFTFCLILLDTDECEDERNECNDNALCTNTEGSYVCRCLEGYQGDGKTCIGRALSSV